MLRYEKRFTYIRKNDLSYGGSETGNCLVKVAP